MFCSVQSMGLSGIESYPVTVEVDCRRGLPRFDIVGLPDTAVKESRERVHSAIGNLGYTFPAGVLVVNLAPADTKKSGPLYDLPILLGILAAVDGGTAEGLVGVLLIQPVILVQHAGTLGLQRGDGAEQIPHDFEMVVHLTAAAP